MTKEQMEKLEGIRESIDELLDEGDGAAMWAAPKRSVFRMSLATVQKMIRARLGDAFQVGDLIFSQRKAAEAGSICWVVIGKNRDGDNSLTLWGVEGFGGMRFDERSKQYPYGHALWRDCSLRAKLNGEVLEELPPEDAAAIAAVKKYTYAPNQDGGALIETEDKLWPLSACEAGFAPDADWSEDEGTAYPYFGNDETRQIGDWFRLRSAYRGYASGAWHVSTSGAASYSYATNAFRPAPACVIR